MMSRRASPRARTTRIAPTAPCVPVDRVGAPVPRSGPPDAGPVTGETAPARAWKVDRSVAQGRPADPTTAGWTPAWPTAARRSSSGGLAVVAVAIYLATQTDRVLRPLRLAGRGIPRGPGGDPLPGPGLRRDRTATRCSRTSCPSRRRTAWRAGSLPFPPLPALLLLPFVAICGLRRPTTRRCSRCWRPWTWPSAGGCSGGWAARSWSGWPRRSSSPSGRCSGTPRSWRTTWYQAHIVAVGLLMLAVGLAMRADPAARDDEPGFEDPDAPPPMDPRAAAWRRERLASTRASSPSASCSAWRARRA